MCGISGIANANVERETLERMAAALSHRGPDDRGTVLLAGNRVGFAHARLSIIDLSPGGHQPMSDRAGEVWVTYNGEIYNFIELRDELHARGHEFHTSSDTEVLLAAYREWGRACVTRLSGMFSFALFDERSGVLLLARDRAGEKPLFWWRDGERLLFASELKALAVDPSFPRRINAEALDTFLAYGYSGRTRAMFDGVNKLPAAHTLAFDTRRGTIDLAPYWELPPLGAVADGEELLAEFERLLSDSVRRQLTAADVPVGILLSGGLDSGLVTAMAARASSRPVKTFTVSFPGHAEFDEGPRAQLIASHFGTDHTTFVAEPAALDLLPRLARQFDDPIADHALIPTYLLSGLIREQATVALTGDGGDELFGGYPHYSWIVRQEAWKSRVPRFARKAVAHAASRWMPIGARGRNHFAALGGDEGSGLAAINLYFDPASRAQLVPRLASLHRSFTPEQEKLAIANGGSPLRRAQRADFLTTLSEAYLVKVDRASMLRSLETRAPFLDHRLIEFAFARVPDRMKVDGDERKILPRRLAEKLLPPALDLRRKQGFTIPLAAWFAKGWGAFIEETLQESLFDRGVVASLLEGQRRGRNNASRLFALTMFELWRREYRATID